MTALFHYRFMEGLPTIPDPAACEGPPGAGNEIPPPDAGGFRQIRTEGTRPRLQVISRRSRIIREGSIFQGEVADVKSEIRCG